MRPILAKILKKDRVVIRKTDDESTRYAKQMLRQKKFSFFTEKEKEQQRILEARQADVKKLAHMHRLLNTNYNRNELVLNTAHLDKRK